MAQSKLISQPATSDGSGNITISFESINVNATFSGTVSVPSSETSVQWSIVLNGTPIATITGPSGFGPFQITSSDVLELTSTNSTPNSSYQAVALGTLTTAGAAPIIPTPTTVAVTEITGPPPGLVYGPVQSSAGGDTFLVPVQPGYRTLQLVMTVNAGHPPTITNILAQGAQSFIVFREGAPYLGGELVSQNTVFFVIPITATSDTEIQITTTGGAAGAYTINVYADTDAYDETRYYNGQAQGQTLTAPGTIVTGPCRLLSASIKSSSGAAAITLSTGATLLSTSTSSVGNDISFAENTILPAGVTAGAIGTVSEASILSAYP